LPDGYGSLSAKALDLILPALRAEVITYDKAVVAAGFAHHSRLDAGSGEILPQLPYYGQALQRHVGFGTGRLEDPPERRFGRIANPTVHIGLNQVRLVVNALLARYGPPAEVVVEVGRELKQSRDERLRQAETQARNQRRNARLKADAAEVLGVQPEHVRRSDLDKLVLWEELSHDVADRRCPYSGVQISLQMLLSDEVEIEHILPFSRTLDDSLNNRTVAIRAANRVKGNRTPWEARDDFERQGWTYDSVLERAAQMALNKRYRFAEDGYQRWLRDDKDFLARALNDTRYLSRIAREYLSLVCPQGTRVIPGRMTALLRQKFGLNGILGVTGEKNRDDHRHHAVDACVIGVTDQAMLAAFARASASARERHLHKLVDEMPLPWPTYREHVARAASHIWVSHKPDHGHEGSLHNDTAYALLGDGRVSVRKTVEGKRQREEGRLKVIEISEPAAAVRHGVLPDGSPRPYKGYKGDSNYCIEVYREDDGSVGWRVVSTFEAYTVVRRDGVRRLRDPHLSLEGQALVMRLMIGDYVRAAFKGETRLLTVKKIKSNGSIFVAQHNEANVRQREDARDESLIYGSFTARSLLKAGGRIVSVSPTGELRDPGLRG
jgi:CRISPR-associated endonuclease Csn1